MNDLINQGGKIHFLRASFLLSKWLPTGVLGRKWRIRKYLLIVQWLQS